MRRMLDEADLEKKQDKLIAGKNIKIENNVISCGTGVDLKPATASELGGVKIGENVNVTEDGTISVPLIEGPQGPVGPAGSQGPEGLPGQDGVIPEEDLAQINTNKADISNLQTNKADKTELIPLATKDYVNDAIGNLSSIGVEIVETLPEMGKANVIYFVKSAAKTKSTKTTDSYDEYMYIQDKWELIGSTKVDLSAYAKTETVNASLALKQDKLSEQQLANIDAVPNKADTSAIPNKVSQLTNDADYVNKAQTNQLVESYLVQNNYFNTTEIWTFTLEDGSTIDKTVSVFIGTAI